MKPIEELNLSHAQAEVLERMEKYKWYTAKGLQVQIGTLNALAARDILEKSTGIGHTFSPRNAIKFRIAEEKKAPEVTCEQLKGIRVTKSAVLESGSCNGCSAMYPKIRTIYIISLQGIAIRVCGTCKTILLKQLRSA